MKISAAWSAALGRLAAWLVVGLLVGWLYDSVIVGLWVATAGYLALLLFALYRTERWMRHPKRIQPPDLGGICGEMISHVSRIRRRNQQRKKRLRRLAQQFRSSSEAMPDGSIILNERREIVWFNQAAARLLDLKRGSDMGQRVDNLIRHPEFIHYLDGADYQAPITIGSPVDDGRELSFHVIPYGEGEQLLIIKDVTHQSRLERVRRDFVANASHELRSPLTVISGYLDTLTDDSTLQSEWHEPLEEMRRQAHRMNAIIRDLLELSRLESTGGLAQDEVDVGGLLALVRKEALALENCPRDVTLAIDSGDRLYGVESELHSAFANLVTNAANYTPRDGSIRIRWWSDADGGHVSVSDTGVGIPAELIPRLTERFYRVDPGRPRRDSSGGTGLGLAIVKHVLQRHQARLEIQSQEGRGSTFTCHFPAERLVPAAVSGAVI